MPRPKKLPDEAVCDHALALMREAGSEAVTFAALSTRAGLSGAALVQRFGTRQGLIHAALAHAWDGLDAMTRQAVAEAARTPEGAIDLLGRLSTGYGDIETYADGLRVLREDLRHPDLRARGEAWVATLAAAIGECFAGTPSAPPGIGLMMVAQWQGALLLWGFSPGGGGLDAFIRDHLRRFVAAQTD